MLYFVIPSICSSLVSFACPPTISTHLLLILFTQGSCEPYNPVIISPLCLPSSHSCFHMIPSHSLCQRALQNLQILFSLVFCVFPHIPQRTPSPSLPVFFSSQGKLRLIILSPLARPSSPFISLSLHNLLLSLSAWSTLGERNPLITAPQHH